MCAATDLGICTHVNENLIAAQFKAILFMKINDIMTRTIIISEQQRDNRLLGIIRQPIYSDLPLLISRGGTY